MHGAQGAPQQQQQQQATQQGHPQGLPGMAMGPLLVQIPMAGMGHHTGRLAGMATATVTSSLGVCCTRCLQLRLAVNVVHLEHGWMCSQCPPGALQGSLRFYACNCHACQPALAWVHQVMVITCSAF